MNYDKVLLSFCHCNLSAFFNFQNKTTSKCTKRVATQPVIVYIKSLNLKIPLLGRRKEKRNKNPLSLNHWRSEELNSSFTVHVCNSG